MKKIIGVVALVALVVFGANQYFTSQVISEVEAYISNPESAITAKAEKIDYNFFTKTLTMNNVTAFDSEEELFTVSKFMIKGYSTEAFDINSGDYPLVADEVLFENFVATSDLAKVESFSLKGWKQNIAAVAEILENPNATPEEVFIKFMTFSFDNLNIKGMSANDYEMLYALGDLNIQTNKETSTYNLDLANLMFADGYMSLEMDEAKVVNAPSIDVEMLSAILENSYDMEDAITTFTTQFYSSFYSSQVEQTATVKGVRMHDTYYDEGMFTLKEYTQTTTNAGQNTTFKLDTLEFLNIMDEESAEALKMDQLIMDMSGTANMNKEMTAFDMDITTNLRELLDVQFKTDIKLPVSYPEIATALAAEDFMTLLALMATEVNDLSVSWSDKGLMPRIVSMMQYEAASYGEEITVEQFLEMSEEEILYMSEDLYYFGIPDTFTAQLIPAVIDYLYTPGNISIDLVTKGMTVEELSNEIMYNAEQFPFGVTYTAGDKTTQALVDELNATVAQ